MTRVALFDLDNTLFDRQSAYERWAWSFATRRGLGEEAVRLLREADDEGFAARHDVFEAARRHLHLKDSVEELEAQYRAEYPEMITPNPSALAALRRLRTDSWRVGIVTNGPSTQHEKIRRAGLQQLIDGCCVSDEMGVRKPDAQIFVEAVRRCGGDPALDGNVWMIGDSPTYDIAGGRGAGFRTVWLHRDRIWTETEFEPDVIAADVTEAVERILAAPKACT